MLERVSWRADLLAFKDEPMFLALLKYDMDADRQPDPDGQLTSSFLHGSKLHAPVLDIDIPIRVIPSTTSGNCHLYIDKPMPRWKMLLMLWAMMIAGVVEPGNFWWSLRRGGTFVRKPLVAKTGAESMKYSYGMFFKLKDSRGHR